MRKLITTEQDREEFIREVMKASLDKPYIAEFKVFRKVRSLAHNRLFWMWLRCVRNETGNDIDTLHDYFCEKYLPWNETECFGESLRKRTGTSDLDSKEFSDFLEKIRIEMMEMNIYLPMPEDKGWNEFYAKYGIE